MIKLSEIYEGWKNYVFPNPEIEALAKERIAVCSECDHLNALLVCTACGCPRAGKARSPESRCPHNKWKDGWGDVNPVESKQPNEEKYFPPVLYVSQEMLDQIYK